MNSKHVLGKFEGVSAYNFLKNEGISAYTLKGPGKNTAQDVSSLKWSLFLV